MVGDGVGVSIVEVLGDPEGDTDGGSGLEQLSEEHPQTCKQEHRLAEGVASFSTEASPGGDTTVGWGSGNGSAAGSVSDEEEQVKRAEGELQADEENERKHPDNLEDGEEAEGERL